MILIIKNMMLVGHFSNIEEFANFHLNIDILDIGTVIVNGEALTFTYNMEEWTVSEAKRDLFKTSQFKGRCKALGYEIYKAERIN